MAVVYELPTWLIVLGVLVMSFVANELGFRFGRFIKMFFRSLADLQI